MWGSGRTMDLELKDLRSGVGPGFYWLCDLGFNSRWVSLGFVSMGMMEGLVTAIWLVWWRAGAILQDSCLSATVAMCVRQWGDQRGLGEPWKSLSVGERRGGCLGVLRRFALTWTSFLSCSLLTCVTVWTIMWVSTQFLAQTPFPWLFPLLLWARLQFAYKVLFVVRVKRAVLWAATLWL